MCRDQTKLGRFSPHMTLSHFESLDEAQAAQEKLSAINLNAASLELTFIVDKIYLLERGGDGGQFVRVAEVGLGQHSSCIVLDNTPPFPGMPTEEEDWVHEERMKLKLRRNYGKKRGGRSRRGGERRRKSGQVPDTPEVIARKRAERKAKRERNAEGGGT